MTEIQPNQTNDTSDLPQSFETQHQIDENIIEGKNQSSVIQSDFNIPCSKQLGGKKGRPSLYQGAQYPYLIDRVKEVLPEHDYNMSEVLKLPEFKPLLGSSDIPRFISKFILNRQQQKFSHSNRAKSIGGLSQLDYLTRLKDLPSSETFLTDNTSLKNTQHYNLKLHTENLGETLQREITANCLREFMFLPADDRFKFLEAIHARNSQSLIDFLRHLKNSCSNLNLDGLFRICHELCVSIRDSIQVKTRLFVASLLFYNNENIAIDSELIRSSMCLLATRPDILTSLGLASFIFVNEIQEFVEYSVELDNLNAKNIGVVSMMTSLFQQWFVDFQVVRLLPGTLFILNKPFIRVMKEDHGLGLIRGVPIEVVQYIIAISSLSQAQSEDQLKQFLMGMREIFNNK